MLCGCAPNLRSGLYQIIIYIFSKHMIRARNFNYYLSFKRIVVLSKPHRHHQTNKFDLAKFDIQWICSMPQSLIGLLQNPTASGQVMDPCKKNWIQLIDQSSPLDIDVLRRYEGFSIILREIAIRSNEFLIDLARSALTDSDQHPIATYWDSSHLNWHFFLVNNKFHSSSSEVIKSSLSWAQTLPELTYGHLKE